MHGDDEHDVERDEDAQPGPRFRHRPAGEHRDVACAAAITTGTKNGRLSIGSSSSASRVFTAIALNSVPTATMPNAASTAMPAEREPDAAPSGRL